MKSLNAKRALLARYSSIPLLGIVSLALIAIAADAPEPFPRVPPTEPAKAADTFRTLDGFKMDLIAAEPLVTDPVAMAYDEDGRAYVAEMNDYPYTDPKTHQAFKENTTDAAIGKIRLLVDTDGDGIFDKSTVFVDHLSWPTGVACYKGGVFVAATPDLWYFKDTDGDGKADVKTKVLTGFKKFNIQAVMNNLIWGLDNCIYGAGGTNGGSITPADDKAGKPVTLTRNDFRFDPATHKFEAIAGGARFGNTFDDWGNRFICNIRNPGQHVVLENRYLTRNPYLTVPSTLQDVAESGDALPVYRISPPELWRDVRARRFATERNSNQPRSELVAAGVVTSASGITIYRGDAYPWLRNHLFIGEVANNLVHRQELRRSGATFTSRRIDSSKEFVASTDVWFRPVNFINAPDGTLHVLDMYREVIEHPWSIPDDIRERLDLRSGADRGRIYRLTPPDYRRPKPPRLGSASNSDLVAALGHPNSWWRETAQRLIVERQDKSVIPLLRDLVANSDNPLARLHALWSLEGLAAIGEERLSVGLKDPAAGVRQNAVRIAERHLKDFPKLIDRLLELAADADAGVRFQVALTLGESQDERVTATLTRIAAVDAADPWMVTAVLSSSASRAHELLAHLIEDPIPEAKADQREVLERLAVIVGARNKLAEFRNVLITEPLPTVDMLVVASGLSQGLRRNRTTLREALPADSSSAAIAKELLDAAYKTAVDPEAAIPRRVMAIRVVGFDVFDHAKGPLTQLIDPREPSEVQHAAIAALAVANHPAAAEILLSKWSAYTPVLRSEVVQAMLSYRNRIPLLLDAVEKGKVAAHDIPSARRAALLKDKDPTIAARAAKLFGSGAGDRQAAIEKYLPALNGMGDPAAGQKIYEANCATCHRLGDQGFDVGPNLATVRQWGPEQLLVNILDPGREVAPQFSEYVVELADGQSLSGVVADESPTSLTLRWAGGGQRVISRADIRKIFATRASPMPEGLESAIPPQQMVDLIAFLRSQH